MLAGTPSRCSTISGRIAILVLHPSLMPKKTLPAELVDPDGSIARRKLADIYDDSLRDELPVFAPEDTSCVACADPIAAGNSCFVVPGGYVCDEVCLRRCFGGR